MVVIGLDDNILHMNVAEEIEEHEFLAYPLRPKRFKAIEEAQTFESILVLGDLNFVIRKDGCKVINLLKYINQFQVQLWHFYHKKKKINYHKFELIRTIILIDYDFIYMVSELYDLSSKIILQSHVRPYFLVVLWGKAFIMTMFVLHHMLGHGFNTCY